MRSESSCSPPLRSAAGSDPIPLHSVGNLVGVLGVVSRALGPVGGVAVVVADRHGFLLDVCSSWEDAALESRLHRLVDLYAGDAGSVVVATFRPDGDVEPTPADGAAFDRLVAHGREAGVVVREWLLVSGTRLRALGGPEHAPDLWGPIAEGRL